MRVQCNSGGSKPLELMESPSFTVAPIQENFAVSERLDSCKQVYDGFTKARVF